MEALYFVGGFVAAAGTLLIWHVVNVRLAGKQIERSESVLKELLKEQREMTNDVLNQQKDLTTQTISAIFPKIEPLVEATEPVDTAAQAEGLAEVNRGFARISADGISITGV